MTPPDSNWGDFPPEAAERVKAAVADGIRSAMSDPQTFKPAVAALTDPANLDRTVAGLYDAFQRHAKAAAGDAVLSGAKSVLRKLMWASAMLLGVYSVFGWQALVVAWKTLLALRGTP